MQTIIINAYQYPELDAKAKARVGEWLNCDLPIFDKYEQEYKSEELAKLGYSDIDYQYSGFYSQGDGASIACQVDVLAFIKRNKLGNQYRRLLYWMRKADLGNGYITVSRNRWRNYVHEKLLHYDFDVLVDDLWHSVELDFNPDLEELGNLILEEVRSQSRKLYQELEANYDWMTSDEYIQDTCYANDYLFTDYGKPVHHLRVE